MARSLCGSCVETIVVIVCWCWLHTQIGYWVHFAGQNYYYKTCFCTNIIYYTQVGNWRRSWRAAQEGRKTAKYKQMDKKEAD